MATWLPMGDVPNPIFDVNGDPYSGAVLKAYLPGGTTSTPIATAAAGTGGQTSITANAAGKWEVSSVEIIPYIDRVHKWAIYANAAEALLNTPAYMGHFDNVPLSGVGTGDFTLGSVYGTVALMVADTDIAVSTTISTQGYTAAGDGGGSTYFVVAGGTGTDDGGQYHDLDNGLQAKLINTGKVDVRKYGALGAADDATKINAALAAFGHAYIPANHSVTMSTNIEITGDDWTISGDGFDSKILYTGTGNTRIHCVGNRFTIKDIEIDGQNPTVGYETSGQFSYGVRIGEAVGSLLTGFRASGLKVKDVGIDGVLIDNISGVHIEANCEFDNCRRWGVAAIPSLFNIEDILIEGHYKCTNGGGPVGKEFPLGAVDLEQNEKSPSSNYTIKDFRFGDIYSNSGEISALDLAIPMTTESTIISDCTVNDAFFRIFYNKPSIHNVTIAGASGYFRAGLETSIVTQVGDISMRWVDSTRTPVVLANSGYGRRNLFRADYVDDSVFGVAIGQSGSGASSGRIYSDVDGHKVYLRNMSLTGGVSGSYTLNQTVDATITAGDQLFLYVEIDRTDGSGGTDTDKFFSVQLDSGNLIDQQVIIKDQGISNLIYAINAPSSKVSPALSIGLSGTPNQSVDLVIRKCFLFVNPVSVSAEDLKISPYEKHGSYTGGSTGFVSDPSGIVTYRRVGNEVTINIASNVFTGTSDSTGFTITGAPVDIRPSAAQVGFGRGVDNGSGLSTPVAFEMGTNGTITLSSDAGGGLWTASGTKAVSNTTFSYYID